MKATVLFKTVLLTAGALFATASLARASFDWENLEGDIPGVAEIHDANAINPWGIAVSPSGTIFVADNGAGAATAYFQDWRCQHRARPRDDPCAPIGAVIQRYAEFRRKFRRCFGTGGVHLLGSQWDHFRLESEPQ